MPGHDPLVIRWNNVSCMPVFHYRLEFADLVRLHLQRDPPDALALELPGHLSVSFLKAVRRLPELSILLYEDPNGHTTYLPVEPADPFVEAARTAQDMDIPVHFVDINMEEPYPRFNDPVPDPYAIHRIGHATYYKAFRSEWEATSRVNPVDRRREQAMAFHLQELASKHASVFFLCGMVHAAGVLEALNHRQATPLHRLHLPPTQVFHLDPDCLNEVMTTFPLLSAVYEMKRGKLPEEPNRQQYTVRRRFEIHSRPYMLIGNKSPVYDESAALTASLEWIVRRSHFPDDNQEEPTGGPLDRNRALWHIFEEALRHYTEETGDPVKGWQRKVFWRFVRNYALLEGLLLPEFYHMLVASRACVDDNCCYALWRLGSFYPWQTEVSNQPTLRVTGEEVWLGTRKLQVRRWMPAKKPRYHRVVRKHRKRDADPGEWLESFDGNSLCSYPPEDILVEQYGLYLREEWMHILRDEQTQSEPFVTSIEDGIDLRETIRHWSEKRIYVRTRRVRVGTAGAVVIIFDEDAGDQAYPYKMTWLGEHEQESDMAFYATLPEDNVVGPGICRCEYGGFVMTHPPRRMFDVWRDPDYRFFRYKSEVLLATGIDYSRDKNVVYVSARPPRSYMRTFAERLRRQITYIPIGSLSAARLKRIRVFHILSGYDKRDIAKEYIL